MVRCRLKKNDKVVVIAGKDKGKKGKILAAYPAQNRVIVEGASMIKKHTRPTQKNPQGGITEKEGAVHISNVQLICPNCGQPSRIGRRRTEEGRPVRICRKCGQDIDKE